MPSQRADRGRASATQEPTASPRTGRETQRADRGRASATQESTASPRTRRETQRAGRPRPLGEIIRAQRRLAHLSLRQLAAMSSVSNPYLSQIERGLHEPSFRVLQAVADALDTSIEVMLGEAGMLHAEDRGDVGERGSAGDQGPAGEVSATERAIAADPRLTPGQRAALLATYRGYVGSTVEGGAS